VKFVADETRFAEVVALIEAARGRAYQAVNTELVKLYWQLGEYISRKIASAEWGDGVVDELAASLGRRFLGVRGYTRRNLFRMRQFYEAYRGHEKVSPLVTQLPWAQDPWKCESFTRSAVMLLVRTRPRGRGASRGRPDTPVPV
jgi:hypothetical protein